MNAMSNISSATNLAPRQPAGPAELVAFWQDAGPERWFNADPWFDAALHDRFAALHEQAAAGRLFSWEEDAPGALALILLTDQIPRNLYRHNAHAFATDELARHVADRALARGFDQATDQLLRGFFYLPFEHHENEVSQVRAVTLFEKLAEESGDMEGLKWARLHWGLIARFGRFPHRNAMLGRLSTPEEAAYLAEGGFAG
jgi:uncharacterized protein (DUF924 family)